MEKSYGLNLLSKYIEETGVLVKKTENVQEEEGKRAIISRIASNP